MSMLSNLELIRRVPLFALLTAAQAEGVLLMLGNFGVRFQASVHPV